ncbi:MAG: type VI secretion system tip protein VgrG [Myxococcota bacterium]|nr:type VI secretion system tip protein VgrG [Myxococcota bacterium]
MDAQTVGPITIDTPLGDAVTFGSMTGSEGLSQIFAYELEVLSPRAGLNASDLLGHQVTVHLERGDDEQQVRHWNGCVTGFEYIGSGDDERSRYRLIVHPWLWYLTQSADSRIFQRMRIPDIVTKVFRDRGFHDFDNALSGTYAPQEYVVQYRETDFDFVSRLMQRAGIYYFFRHVDGRHTLVLADEMGAHESAAGCKQLAYRPPDLHRDALDEYVRRWRSTVEVATSRFTHADYDFTRPRFRLRSISNTPDLHAAPDLEVYDYPGGFTSSAAGEATSALRLGQRRATVQEWTGETNGRGLTVGCAFQLVDHPREDQNRKYLVTGARYALRGHDHRASRRTDQAKEEVFSSEFRVIRADETFRAPACAPKPLMFGPQTAIVVGPAGQEIWTDQFGRVKVQFHWDREGQHNENSSCFVRVMQAWAGTGWGAQFIPRIGQEVIVDFIEGDPDRPIITGSVYNGTNDPAFKLPNNQTQSGFRTRSTPGGTQANSNEIRFEDMKGYEDLFVHAEGTQTTRVNSDQNIAIGGNRTKSVAGGETIRIDGGRTTAVGVDDATSVLGLQALAVAGARTVQVTGDESHTVEGNLSVAVAGSQSAQITGDLSIDVSGSVREASEGPHKETFADDFVARHAGHRVVIVGAPNAAASISTHVEGFASGYVSEILDVVSVKGMTIRCGKSEIRLTPDSVTISSPTVSLTSPDLELAGGELKLTASNGIAVGAKKVILTSSDASVTLDSNATVQGTKVQLKGGGGASQNMAKRPEKLTTIKLVDRQGRVLANQRVTLRTGGEGGPERTVVLDDTGSIELAGDGPFEAIVADLPDAKPS